MQTAADVMSSPVESIAETATVAAALQAMRHRGVSCLLVTPADSDERPGFISQSDVVNRVLAHGLDADAIRVGEVMSRPLITVDPGTPVRDCARVMSRAQIRRVIVRDGDAIVGIVSTADVLEMGRAEDLPAARQGERL